jgi:hypothetical protein
MTDVLTEETVWSGKGFENVLRRTELTDSRSANRALRLKFFSTFGAYATEDGLRGSR